MRSWRTSIGGSALTVASATLVLVASSAAVTIVATALFGASRATDAYFVAMTAPTLLVNVIASTTSTIAVPLIVRARLRHDEAAARALSWRLGWGVLAALSAGSALVWLLRQPLLGLLAPGFAVHDRLQSEMLLTILLPGGVLTGTAAALGAILNASRRFFLPAVAPTITNGVIFAALALRPEGGVTSWATGFSLGSAVSLAALLVGLQRNVNGAERSADPRISTESAELLSRAPPTIWLALVLQLAAAAARAVASTLPEGTVTALSISLTVANLPLGFTGYALGIVLLPAFADLQARDVRAFAALYGRATRALTLMLTIVAAILVVAAEPLVRLLFNRGAFDDVATRMTAESLRVYALSLPALPIEIVSHRALLAAGLVGAIAVRGTLTSVVMVLASLAFAPYAQHVGIAAAYSAQAWLNAVFFGGALHGRILEVDVAAAFRFSFKVLLSGAIATLVGMAWLALLPPLSGGPGSLVAVVSASMITAAIYSVALSLGHVAEIRRTWRSLRGGQDSS